MRYIRAGTEIVFGTRGESRINTRLEDRRSERVKRLSMKWITGVLFQAVAVIMCRHHHIHTVSKATEHFNKWNSSSSGYLPLVGSNGGGNEFRNSMKTGIT